LPEDLANCSKLTKLDVEVLVRSLLRVLDDGWSACTDTGK